MKSRIFLALLAGASVFAASARAQANGHPAPPVAAPVTATGPAVAANKSVADSSRANAGQALRFESSWGSADIIRGAEGPVVGTVGWFRGFDVEKLVESSPRAVAEAKTFQSKNFRGSLVSTIG